jgi:8-oxo-dGTP pyrophosphatase MutT (NUDIX family)
MINFEESYIGQLLQIRNLTQKDYRFLVPAARAVIRDSEGGILLVRRKDNGKWVMPSGSQELGETIYGCMKRETKEETGIDVVSARLMAIYNYYCQPGDFYQTLHVQFLVEEWLGKVVTVTDETTDAHFWTLNEIRDAIPNAISSYYQEVIDDFQKFDGNVIMR